MSEPLSFLFIQTAFIGDVVLATAMVEKLHERYPEASIDFLLRKGNEGLFRGHPFIRNVLIWDKKKGKTKNLLAIIRQVRAARYDTVVNAHRFISSGLITAFSGAKTTIGFDQNPMSFLFTHRVKHRIESGIHEVMRNQELLTTLTGGGPARPRLYPTASDAQTISPYRQREKPYVCIAPTSVWFTKQYPAKKWIAFLDRLPGTFHVFLLGGASDVPVCESIRTATTHANVVNLSGKLNFLESAALMQHAAMNYANDSAPIHFASAVNAPVTAVFCSTVTDFGFGPLSDKSVVVQTREKLSCRPCGLHGHKACPLGHFTCAYSITEEQLLESVRNTQD